MVDNNENTLGSGFITDNGQTGGADLGSGFVTSAEPSINTPQPGANALANTFTDIKELSVQGAMSTVYQGKKYGKWHIIKRIKPQFKDNPQYRELFMKEFDNGVQLDHPNIVRFEDKGEDAEGLWYTMEYVDGRPLSDMIKTGELIKNERLTRSIITQLCDALTYVHKKQIVHRDLKPDNILVTYRGDNVKVLDFGLAYSDSYDDHLVKAGTPKYAAPEQMTKGNLVDQRADIYAVGMILLEMCTGSLVDKEASTVQNPNFQLVIKRATQTAPEQRYHDCREIMDDLNSTIVQGASIQQPAPAEVKPAPHHPTATTVEGERKKNKLPLILGIIAAAAIIGIVIFFLTRDGGTTTPPTNNTADNTTTEQPTTKPDQNTAPDQTVTPAEEPKQDNGYTEEEIQQDKENDPIKTLIDEANQAFNDKNLAKAKSRYEELLKKTDLPKETKDEASKQLDFCNKTISQSKLYALKQVKDSITSLIGFENSEHYIVVDFLYSNVNSKSTTKNLLAVQKSNKWGLIDDATKLPVTDFIYDKVVKTTDNDKYELAYKDYQDYLQIDKNGKLIVERFQNYNRIYKGPWKKP